ncbi:hypothetical protein Tco_0570642 [Tanacetum coccineum]
MLTTDTVSKLKSKGWNQELWTPDSKRRRYCSLQQSFPTNLALMVMNWCLSKKKKIEGKFVGFLDRIKKDHFSKPATFLDAIYMGRELSSIVRVGLKKLGKAIKGNGKITSETTTT